MDNTTTKKRKSTTKEPEVIKKPAIVYKNTCVSLSEEHFAMFKESNINLSASVRKIIEYEYKKFKESQAEMPSYFK